MNTPLTEQARAGSDPGANGAGRRLASRGAIVLSFIVALEIVIMISPFALFFYAVFNPVLLALDRVPATRWLTAFFLPHMVISPDPAVSAIRMLGSVAFIARCGRRKRRSARRRRLLATELNGTTPHREECMERTRDLVSPRPRARMPRLICLKLGVAVLVVGVVTAAIDVRAGSAQHGMPSPVTGGPPPHMLADMCATAFEKNIGAGRGFGMAFVADQQGYPGPLHVLELKDRLKLTPEQENRAETLLAAMFAESRPKSERLLEAERKLGSVFTEGKADEASVRAAVAEVERARSDVRLVHLMFHLKTRDLLTDEQQRVYHEARWSGHRPMGPHGGRSAGAGSPMK